MRLIDDDALIDVLNASGCVLAMTGDGKGAKIAVLFVKIVKEHAEENTIDAAPVVHGRWKYRHIAPRQWKSFYSCEVTCTNCERVFPRHDGVNFRFCPNCGAEME